MIHFEYPFVFNVLKTRPVGLVLIGNLSDLK